jgi:predicted transcriptional regulator
MLASCNVPIIGFQYIGEHSKPPLVFLHRDGAACYTAARGAPCMTLKEVVEIVQGTVLCGEEYLDREVKLGFASDLMSDVLTLLADDILLITGLSNNQAIRTAEMSDITQILFVRNKKPTKTMIDLAREQNITIIVTPYSMFKSSGLLYLKGLQPIY